MRALSGNDSLAFSAKDQSRAGHAFRSTVCQIDNYRVHNDDVIDANVDGVNFGALDIYRYEFSVVQTAIRTIRHIQADHVDDFLLTMPLREGVQLKQGNSCVRVQPGGFAFLATSKPFESMVLSGDHEEYLIKLSGSALRQCIPFIDDCCACNFNVQSGAGAMMQSLFALAFQQGEGLPRNCATQLGKAMIETIAVATLEDSALTKLKKTYRKPAHERTRDFALDYIDQHLAKPDLCVEEIASYCRISVRSLHAAFAVTGRTVSSHVREQRLLRCREALTNPDMKNKSIIEIALKWGFNDPSHFSHIYRARFGCAASDHRDMIISS